MDVPSLLSRHLTQRALDGGSRSEPRGTEVRLHRAERMPFRKGERILLAHRCPPPRRKRTAVAEIVHHDTARQVWVVAPVDGPWAAWFRCLRHRPAAVVKAGFRQHHVSAYFLTPAEGAEVMAAYASRRPRAARALYRRLGLLRGRRRDVPPDADRRIALVRLSRFPTI